MYDFKDLFRFRGVFGTETGMVGWLRGKFQSKDPRSRSYVPLGPRMPRGNGGGWKAGPFLSQTVRWLGYIERRRNPRMYPLQVMTRAKRQAIRAARANMAA